MDENGRENRGGFELVHVYQNKKLFSFGFYEVFFSLYEDIRSSPAKLYVVALCYIVYPIYMCVIQPPYPHRQFPSARLAIGPPSDG